MGLATGARSLKKLSPNTRPIPCKDFDLSASESLRKYTSYFRFFTPCSFPQEGHNKPRLRLSQETLLKKYVFHPDFKGKLVNFRSPKFRRSAVVDLTFHQR